MEPVLEFVAALLLWRVIVSILIAIAVGAVLAFFFPAIAGALVICSLIFGATAGVVWQSGISPRISDESAEPPISKPIAFAGLALMGAFCGGLAIAASGSIVVSFIFLSIAPFVFGPLVFRITRRRIAPHQMMYASCALVIGLLAPLLLRMATGAGAL